MGEVIDALKAALHDRYTIEREIGSGGMATVYLAEDLKHHRKVAIKVLRPDLAATLGPERFLREIEVAAQLQHPHILPLHDSGEADGFLFYVMPFVEGQSLRDKLAKEGELPIGEVVRILRDVVDALTEAHANGVVHRDIKPENILLRGRHALVTDFGVAKAVSEATGREKLTTAGIALGTPAYMAPEQASADPHLDHRVDIYAVGAVAYELLTGRPVFMGATPQMTLAAHVTEAPQPVSKHRETVPGALESVVMRCLEKKPADRFQTAEELLPQLEALVTPSGGMTPTDTRPLAATFGRRRSFAPLVLATAAVLTVIGLVLSRMLTTEPINVGTSNIMPVTSEPGRQGGPAISPDGSQVAFVRTGPSATSATVIIRSTLNVAGGGEVIPAPEGPRTQVAPQWSPDGEFIRFLEVDSRGSASWKEVGKFGGSIRTVDLPQNVRGLDLLGCTWSSDWSQVVYSAADSIFVYSYTDESSTLVAATEVARAAHWFVWSPDGDRIAFVNGLADWALGLGHSPTSIWVVDAGGGEPVRVTSNEHMDVSPAWLDEGHLLFVSNRDGPEEVYVIAIGSNGPKGEPQKVPGPTDPHMISYSITGQKLAYAKRVVKQNVFSVPLGQRRPVPISDAQQVTSGNQTIEMHDVSPDGKWIAYDSELRGNQDIYKLSLEGGNPERLTNDPRDEFGPSWSPGGTEIAFYAREGPGATSVMVMSASGGTPETLRDLPLDANLPVWSPSGLEIAFSSAQSGQTEAWLVSRDSVGGGWHRARQLTNSGCGPAGWTPDGSGLLCWAGPELVLFSRDGVPLWRLNPEPVTFPLLRRRAAFSRDGSHVYFWGSMGAEVHGVWSIPVSGGEPRLVVMSDALGPVGISVGPDNLYMTVGDYESDIWVADLEW
jgi:serine/threonine-protein kinase